VKQVFLEKEKQDESKNKIIITQFGPL